MNSEAVNKQIDDIVKFITTKTDIKPEIGISLSTTLADIADIIQDKVVIPYTEIPHLPPNSCQYTTVGNLILGKLNGKNVMVMQGRMLLFEGHTAKTATLLTRVMRKMGVETIFIVSTGGGLNYHFRAGEIMLVTDHVNFTGQSPLTGENLDNFGPRFCSMFDIYDSELQDITRVVATENRINLCQGVYIGIAGPEFPTRAELRLMLENGNDAVGMSVVHEAIVAAHSGMKILGLILIADMALPYSIKQSTMGEIAEQAKLSIDKMKILVKEVIKKIE
ncbi:MAG: purine nucleoside phosphorylase [Burkholderiales bacterium]|jgi:purine-nucleoside phosphorylase|nr:purine nucleoside phosphorylase [Burkholderiales bacterium]